MRSPIRDIVRNEVRVHQCENWDAFVSSVRKDWPIRTGENECSTARFVLFRGHAQPEWPLMSRLERTQISYGKREDGSRAASFYRNTRGVTSYNLYCSAILEKFRRLSTGLPGTYPGMPDDELWALGRHHGLLTPLLDWTESPYVAAYFAFENDYRPFSDRALVIGPQQGTVRIWGLRFWHELEKAGEFEVVRVFPAGGARQRAQRGLFTKLLSAGHPDIESYLKARGLAHCLEAYDIARVHSPDALRDLQLMNITAGTLFPDLDGAAAQANIDDERLRSYAFDREFTFDRPEETPES